MQRNILLLFSAVLAFSSSLLAVLLFFKTERTIIVPTSGSSFWVEEQRVSSEYLEKMGMYLSDLLFNRSPADVNKKNQTILEYVHPSSYHEIKKLLRREQEAIEKGNQSFFFRIERTFVDMEQNAFIAEGEFIVFVGKNGEAPFCAQNERKKYVFHFACLNGKLLLTSLKKGDIK